MKLHYMIAVIMMAFSIGANAQDWSTDVYKYGEQYPGYVILEDGTKVEGYIEYQNRYTMQNEVMFYKEKDNRKSKEKYKTADLKEYKVADKLYHCIHYSGGLMAKPIRANLVVAEGCIMEYVWYDRAENWAIMQKGANESEEEFMNRMYPSKMLYKKQNEEEVRSLDYFGLKFASKMSEFVSDNKALATKVSNKEKGYGMLQIQAIINEYNAECEQ